jgi:hypothetical protein
MSEMRTGVMREGVEASIQASLGRTVRTRADALSAPGVRLLKWRIEKDQ